MHLCTRCLEFKYKVKRRDSLTTPRHPTPFISLSARPVTLSHCSRSLRWKLKTLESKTYIHANNSALKCNGKAWLRVLCTLRRPVSMTRCSLKAYGLKWQRGAGDAWAIISPRLCSCRGTRPLSRKGEGREGNDRRSPTVAPLRSTHAYTAHTLSADWHRPHGISVPNLSPEVRKSSNHVKQASTVPCTLHLQILESLYCPWPCGGFRTLCKRSCINQSQLSAIAGLLPETCSIKLSAAKWHEPHFSKHFGFC